MKYDNACISKMHIQLHSYYGMKYKQKWYVKSWCMWFKIKTRYFLGTMFACISFRREESISYLIIQISMCQLELFFFPNYIMPQTWFRFWEWLVLYIERIVLTFDWWTGRNDTILFIERIVWVMNWDQWLPCSLTSFWFIGAICSDLWFNLLKV